MCRPKLIKAGFWHQNHHSESCSCGGYISVPPTSGSVPVHHRLCLYHSFAMASRSDKEPEVIDIPDDGNEEDDWQDVSPVNVAEAKAYKDKVEEVFKTLSLMLKDDRKDTIPAMVTTFKKLAAKHWTAMTDAGVDTVMSSMRDSTGIYCRQTLTEGGVDIVESVAKAPSPREFLQSLPQE